MNGAVSLLDGPLEIVAEAFADFSHEVLPAGEAVFTRERELGVALRQGVEFGSCARARAMAAASPAAMSRASFLACLRRESRDGRGGRDLKRSLRPPFMNRLCPAETRLKEGAHAHDSDQNRWESSLAAGGWRPVSALPGSILSLRDRTHPVRGKG